jgi:hypothetical protein
MTVTLPLTPEEEAKLQAAASAAGTTPEKIIRQAIEPILAQEAERDPSPEELRSLLGVWAQFGPGPSEEEIDRNRAEMFATFGRDDIA